MRLPKRPSQNCGSADCTGWRSLISVLQVSGSCSVEGHHNDFRTSVRDLNKAVSDKRLSPFTREIFLRQKTI